MNKTLLTLFLFLLAFSFAAQAEVVEKTRWSGSIVITRGIAAGTFDEATQTVYAATADNGDRTPDNVWVTYDSGVLELTTPAKLRATYTYNVPSGGIAGQVDGAMYLVNLTTGGKPEITEPTTLSGGIVQEKIIRIIASSRDLTSSIVSQSGLPAGRYDAFFEFRVPGFVGWPEGRELRADSISGAKLVSIRLETVALAAKGSLRK